ncbi:N-6 DNA methylase [Aliarcobacter butzleri]|uniref:N-6 DNA methylase n=1 Tax=Aliarcobacter butzleri TaxID=28197 RepID=UPI00125F1F20|nr:N-6 DNA methylase [Aliarcobacter butzleri]MCT7644454.1 N-6 DNA methylase [Aliarcobacter butzleri]
MKLEDFKKLLGYLEFELKKDVFTKHFSQFDCDLKVDLKNEKLIYPIEKGFIVNSETTSNFSSNENFVVFECVHRLLNQGYKPESIELEPSWKLGHSNKSGRADIFIKNLQNQPLLIIECKTAGREFEKAWKYTLEDGGQLFSYLEQEKAVEFIALYASDFINNEIVTSQKIISHKDNETILIENKELKSFKDAKNVKERYKVWKDTYKQEFTEKGIFEENIQAYQIGKDKYTLDIDTKPIDATDKKGKYHQFRTILRKYNVSRRENAFEVLVNLFLCKIVDETENPNDLKFYWKGIAYDSYFDLVDRLQELYKIGMDKFLKQDIVYISNKDIDKAFWTMKQKRNATKDTIKDIFRQLKFFKGLDFEFVKVHNQQGFDKNAKILLEIIQMWQGLRLLTTEQNQFLGDMFEFFLDNGIKQSEGQFFTPVPICKFIVSSLPLEDKISNSSEPIKAIDYACGAGHFLNEYALNITPIVKKHKNESAVNEYYKNIYGIEKEDRLAKVAKVSAFMYGQDEINIIDADALDNNKEIKEQSFDCLVANPPFAVEDFLLTLDEEIREQYELIETINDLGNKNIQCFFLERAKQLLAPNGVAGIIVPSSILNNSDNTHIKTREILIKYFDFVSIVELGSQTFGKTGTNTVILFIKRKGLKPEVATHFKNRIDDFFEDWESEKNSNGGAYQDTNIISSYCNHLDIDINLYEKILQNILDEKLFDIEIFAEYKKAFENSTEIKNLKDKKQFKDKSAKEQKEELEEKLLKYIQKCEKEKLYFYMLSFNNPTKVLVVKSPSDNKEQKNFLGYEWSGAKGSEGIKYFDGENINDIQTPLFDPKNIDNEEKISYLIKEHFSGNTKTIKDEYKEHCSYINLADMLDFNRVEFNKSINLSVNKKVEIESKYPLVKLGEKFEISKGKSITQKETIEGNVKVVAGGLDFAYLHNISNRPKNTITISASGANAGYVNFWNEEIFASDCTTIYSENITLTTYAYNVLKVNQNKLFDLARGSAQPHVYPKDIENFKIPFPEPDIQEQVVNECKKLDAEVLKANKIIEQSKQNIENGFLELFSNATHSFKLSNDDIFDVSIGRRVLAKEIEENPSDEAITVYSANVFEPFGYIKKDLLKDFSKDSVLWGIDGDWMVNFMPKEKPFYPTDHCGVVRIKQDVLHGRYLAWALNNAGIEFRFSRANRASTERIKGMVIKAPSFEEQNKFALEVEKLEKNINDAKKIIDTAKDKKEEILKKYL